MELFKKYDFPLTVNGISAGDVVKVSKNDKKMVSGKVKFILLEKMGNSFIDMTVTDDEMIAALDNIIV